MNGVVDFDWPSAADNARKLRNARHMFPPRLPFCAGLLTLALGADGAKMRLAG